MLVPELDLRLLVALVLLCGALIFVGWVFGLFRRFLTGFGLWVVYYVCFETLRSAAKGSWFAEPVPVPKETGLLEVAQTLWQHLASLAAAPRARP
jgi:hypothetical protein